MVAAGRERTASCRSHSRVRAARWNSTAREKRTMNEDQATDGGGSTSGAFIPARTILGENGRILLFSCDQFVAQFCDSACSFFCGKPQALRLVQHGRLQG